MARRFKLTVEYDGTGFVGWQRQDNGPSIQQSIERAAFDFCGETVTLKAAGRTDAGVHATGQVAHIDLERPASAHEVMNALNHFLKPLPIAVIEAQEVDDAFHARFSAIGRGYVYRIANRRGRLALDLGRAWWIAKPLDHEAMDKAAKLLLGTHDFTTFRASECQARSPIKTMDVLDVIRVGDEVRVIAKARSFLHHQVRNIVGTLERVGAGRWSVERVAAALAACDRRAGGPTAPPTGLYLTDVTYPED